MDVSGNADQAMPVATAPRTGKPPLRIKILTSIDGVDFAECYNNRQMVTIDDLEINFISLADLKKNKKASGRHRDLDDLEHLS